jgi:predicted nucleic acid-binding protein
VKAVSNASPLISLARIGQLAGVQQLFDTVYISTEVYNEVVIAGAGMPGADAISEAGWVQVRSVRDTQAVANSMKRGLGIGETSAVQLAQELEIETILMDEWRGRRLAKQSGLAVVGFVGILEELYRCGSLPNLAQAYEELLRQNMRIDPQILQRSLQSLNLL